MKSKRYLLAAAAVLAWAVGAYAQEVVRFEGDTSLESRYAWALDQADDVQTSSGIWIGYSFSRMMCENCYSGSFHDSDWDDMPSLRELISGIRLENENRNIRDAAKRALREVEGEGRLVRKNMAVLVRFERNSRTPSELEMSNMSLAFDLGDRALVWLGSAQNEESIQLLASLYDSKATKDARKGAIWAVGSHDASDLAVPFLSSVLTSRASSEFRKSAAYGLGNQNSQKSLSLLRSTALSDSSEEVSKAAVYALGNMDLSAAAKALEDLVTAGEEVPVEVQKAALYSIGNTDDPGAESFLKETATSASSSELAKAAVYALSNAVEEGDVKPLMDILRESKHTEVRKAAVYSIGNHESSSAIEALQYVLENDESTEVRKAAVHALGNIDSDEARRVLISLIGDIG